MSKPICPECRDGKHQNCDGTALDLETDLIVPCGCAIAGLTKEKP